MLLLLRTVLLAALRTDTVSNAILARRVI